MRNLYTGNNFFDIMTNVFFILAKKICLNIYLKKNLGPPEYFVVP